MSSPRQIGVSVPNFHAKMRAHAGWIDIQAGFTLVLDFQSAVTFLKIYIRPLSPCASMMMETNRWRNAHLPLGNVECRNALALAAYPAA